MLEVFTQRNFVADFYREKLNFVVKLWCSKGGWVTLGANFRGKGRRPPMNFGVRKLEYLGYHVALFASSYV